MLADSETFGTSPELAPTPSRRGWAFAAAAPSRPTRCAPGQAKAVRLLARAAAAPAPHRELASHSVRLHVLIRHRSISTYVESGSAAEVAAPSGRCSVNRCTGGRAPRRWPCKFKALADPVRLRLLSAIACHAGGEACVCDMSDGVEVSQPTISHHLKVLREAGLLTRERRASWVYYAVVPDALAQLSRVARRPTSAGVPA